MHLKIKTWFDQTCSLTCAVSWSRCWQFGQLAEEQTLVKFSQQSSDTQSQTAWPEIRQTHVTIQGQTQGHLSQTCVLLMRGQALCYHLVTQLFMFCTQHKSKTHVQYVWSTYQSAALQNFTAKLSHREIPGQPNNISRSCHFSGHLGNPFV